MNVFWLHLAPQESAKLACDQHIVKMITEHAQMLLTVIEHLGYGEQSMKSLGMEKQLLQWVYFDYANFVYLHELTHQYYLEYQRRFRRTSHEGWTKLCAAVLACGGFTDIRERFIDRDRDAHSDKWTFELQDHGWLYITVPPMYMDDRFKRQLRGDRLSQLKQVVKSYRSFYVGDKSRFARYRHSPIPAFMRGVVFSQQSVKSHNPA